MSGRPNRINLCIQAVAGEQLRNMLVEYKYSVLPAAGTLSLQPP